MSMIRAYLHPNLASSELKQGQKEIVNFSLEIYSNTTWEVGEQGSFLDANIKVYINYSKAQTGAAAWHYPGPLYAHQGAQTF